MKKQPNKTTSSKKTTKAKIDDLSNDNSKDNQTIDLNAKALENEEKLPSLGLGDAIKSVTSALGIETCGRCEERRKNLNKMFPWLNYKEFPQLEGEDLDLMRRVLANPIVQNDDAVATFALYNKIYSSRNPVKRCLCPGLFRQIVERLNLLMPEGEIKKL